MVRAAAAAESRDRHPDGAGMGTRQLSFFQEEDVPAPSVKRRPVPRRPATRRASSDEMPTLLPVTATATPAMRDTGPTPPPAAPAAPIMPEPQRQDTAMPLPGSPLPARAFGTWLLRQEGRDDWIGQLARGARADRAFPRHGDPDAVRKRLIDSGAETDMFEALDIAACQWMGT